LGKLYLSAKQFNGAELAFLASLKTKDRDDRLKHIWLQYERSNSFKEFLDFAKKLAERRYASQFIEILQAESLIAIGQYEQALSHLLRINSPKFESQGLNLQAHIAEYRKDWDAMELRSQRATVLDPEKSDNFLLLARALQNQKKWLQAEEAANDGITRSARENPWLYHNRAWTRWNRKNFEGAENDWRKAIGISPDIASFYFNIALIYERRGQVDQAVIELKKAINLKPDDQRYQKKLEEVSKIEKR
jgi:tetratricopeptide (TPR) repeat protein